MKGEFQKGLRAGIPIALGYLSVSFAFGIQASGSGLTILQAVLISMTNLTSAGQLAGLQVMAAGGSFIEMALSQIIINLRYGLMSLSLGQNMSPSMTTPRRLLAAFGNTDEIFAVAVSYERKVTPQYFGGLVLLPYIGWTLGTFLGALGGAFLPAAITSALGLALYGMFIAIIIPPSVKYKSVCVVVVSAAVMSCLIRALFPAFSGGMVIIVCAIVISALGAALFPLKEDA